MFSYWENNSWFNNIDLVIIGSGITGLSAAIHYKKDNPNKRVLVLERGTLPSGASTKNAGFACFGSVGELLDDLSSSTEQEVLELVENRKKGLDSLQNLIGAEGLDIQNRGGFELFRSKEEFEKCADQVSYLNKLLFPIFKDDVFSIVQNNFGFEKAYGLILNKFESQIDTGLMMRNYIHLAKELDVEILNGFNIDSLEEGSDCVMINSNQTQIRSKQVLVCSNGFAASLFPEKDVLPARAQVLITKPIDNLPFKGTFHLDKGYYYFRNIHNRVLFGGARNMDIKGETTTELSNSKIIMDELKLVLSEVILPNTNYEIDYSWAGIMGVGANKRPIIESHSNRIHLAVRLGGMGVALGTEVGKQASQLIKL